MSTSPSSIAPLHWLRPEEGRTLLHIGVRRYGILRVCTQEQDLSAWTVVEREGLVEIQKRSDAIRLFDHTILKLGPWSRCRAAVRQILARVVQLGT